MSISDQVQDLIRANAPTAREAFPELGDDAQFIEARAENLTSLAAILGPRVAPTPMVREFYESADGAANVFFGERWVSTKEHIAPIIEADPRTYRFDPLSEPDRASERFQKNLEEEIAEFADIEGLEFPLDENASIVAFSYNIIELGTRPTYLFFRDQNEEARVWSSTIDWMETFSSISDYLERLSVS